MVHANLLFKAVHLPFTKLGLWCGGVVVCGWRGLKRERVIKGPLPHQSYRVNNIHQYNILIYQNVFWYRIQYNIEYAFDTRTGLTIGTIIFNIDTIKLIIDRVSGPRTEIYLSPSLGPLSSKRLFGSEPWYRRANTSQTSII